MNKKYVGRKKERNKPLREKQCRHYIMIMITLVVSVDYHVLLLVVVVLEAK